MYKHYLPQYDTKHLLNGIITEMQRESASCYARRLACATLDYLVCIADAPADN